MKGEALEDIARKLTRKMLGRIIPLTPISKISHSISCYRITAYGFYGKADGPAAQLPKTSDFRWVHSHQSGELFTSSLFRKVMQKCSELGAKAQ